MIKHVVKEVVLEAVANVVGWFKFKFKI